MTHTIFTADSAGGAVSSLADPSSIDWEILLIHVEECAFLANCILANVSWRAVIGSLARLGSVKVES